MPQIDSGIIIFNILLTIGILFSARSSSKEDLSNKDNQKIKKETNQDKDNRNNIYKQKLSQANTNIVKKKRSEETQKEKGELTKGEFLLKQVRAKISNSKMPKYYGEDYLIKKEIKSYSTGERQSIMRQLKKEENELFEELRQKQIKKNNKNILNNNSKSPKGMTKRTKKNSEKFIEKTSVKDTPKTKSIVKKEKQKVLKKNSPIEVVKSITGATYWGQAFTEPPEYFTNDLEKRVNPDSIAGYVLLLTNAKIFTLQLFKGASVAWRDLDEQVITDFGREDRYMGMWEACEHILYKECPDLGNIWKMSLCCKRTGRFCYARTKKDLVKLICNGYPNWYYIEFFDQFTKDSEDRFQRKLKRLRKEAKENEYWSKKNAKTYTFDFDPESYKRYEETRVELNNIDTRDCFKILGVDRKVSQTNLRKAYWELAKKYHPDLNKNDKDSEEKFKEINNAYEILSDPIKRSYL